MPDLKKSRSARKGTLTKAYGDLSVLIAEDDYDGVVSQRQKMKALYLKFLESHTDYHDTLEDESDIKTSDEYLCNVQTLYAGQQNVAKAAMKDMQPLSQTRSEANNEQSFAALGHLINLPPLELQKFSGEPEEFDNFIATFNEVIGNVIPDPAAKLLRLKAQVTGIASDAIRMCRIDGGQESYARAIKILRDRFGSPYVVCASVIERLINGPSVRSPSEIRTLADELSNAEITLKNNQMYNEIDTQNNIIQICLRLESSLRYEWRSRVMKDKQSTGVYLSFSHFVSFVQEHAEVVNDPLYGNDALKDGQSRCRSKTTVSSLPSHIQEVHSATSCPDVSTKYNSASNIQCHLCLKNHKLYTCHQFRNMPIDKRCTYAKTNNLCTLCLGKDHSVSECKSTYTCRINNCGERHSSSLHVYNNQLPVVGHCVQACAKSNVHMPTVPVIVNDALPIFALLDTGSSASFCTKRLMNEMKLQGVNMSYQLRTLHGINNNHSEIVNLRVSSRDGTASLEMNNVFVVDEIPVEICSVRDVNKYPHLKDLTFSQASQVDLLIGQDNSAALIPIKVRRGPAGSPYAVLTMMGWCLNGCVSMDIPSSRVVCNFISTNVSSTEMHAQMETASLHEDLLEMSVDEKDSVVVNCHVQSHVSHNMTRAVFTQDHWFVVFCITLLMLCLMCIFLSRNMSQRRLFMNHYTIVHDIHLEASHASMGGVLPQLKYISYVVLYCVYLYTVSHPITIMFSDERNYTLSLLGTSCKHCIYFMHFTYFTYVLSLMTVSIC